jgi:hypothetical protein
MMDHEEDEDEGEDEEDEDKFPAVYEPPLFRL